MALGLSRPHQSVPHRRIHRDRRLIWWAAIYHTAAIQTLAAKAAGTWQKNKMGYFFAVLADQLGLRAPDAGA